MGDTREYTIDVNIYTYDSPVSYSCLWFYSGFLISSHPKMVRLRRPVRIIRAHKCIVNICCETVLARIIQGLLNMYMLCICVCIPIQN